MTQTNTSVAKDKREATRSKSSKPAKAAAPKPNKSTIVVELLSCPEGVTIEAISRVTGWQAHSVRGFLAGTVAAATRAARLCLSMPVRDTGLP